MLKIFKYIFFDLMRSRWSLAYFLFYLAIGTVMLFLNNDLGKAVITLMNIIVVLTPLVGTVFGIMHYYNSREFTELLLAQPLKRSTIFLGQYIGLSLSLSLSLVLGLGLPFLVYGIFQSAAIWQFGSLLLVGVFLTFIFVALAYNMGLSTENKIKGFGYAILIWLTLAIIYDGVFLISLLVFDDYPLDKFALIASLFNPIDLSRILILLKLDISALFGYTGATFKMFLGTNLGMLVAMLVLSLWVVIPAGFILRKAKRKDF
jgi:Cu-processing system permease protein